MAITTIPLLRAIQSDEFRTKFDLSLSDIEISLQSNFTAADDTHCVQKVVLTRDFGSTKLVLSQQSGVFSDFTQIEYEVVADDMGTDYCMHTGHFYATDAEIAVKELVLPSEHASAQLHCSGSIGYLLDGHTHICDECADELHQMGEGSITLFDCSETSRSECGSNIVCQNWVGDKCSNECGNDVEDDDSSICEHCQNCTMEHPGGDDSQVLDAMQLYIARNAEANSDEIESLHDECVVLSGAGLIRWPEDLEDYLDVDENDWLEFYRQIS